MPKEQNENKNVFGKTESDKLEKIHRTLFGEEDAGYKGLIKDVQSVRRIMWWSIVAGAVILIIAGIAMSVVSSHVISEFANIVSQIADIVK